MCSTSLRSYKPGSCVEQFYTSGSSTLVKSRLFDVHLKFLGLVAEMMCGQDVTFGTLNRKPASSIQASCIAGSILRP